ncbi:hypothetical protein P7C71_g3379, partial [Lecanoromycetidae sp. Uapishka_2]
MCIALISTAHPDYALVLINNRDEYINRPTVRAHFWGSPNENVLGGRDLLRKEQGTWLGITKEGRIAVLTNFRENVVMNAEARSRGAMVNAFLTQPAESDSTTEDFIRTLVEGEGLAGVGGFSLSIPWIAKDKGETVGLSNAAFADRSWPKVLRGEKLLSEAIKTNVANQNDEARFIEDMFHLLSEDTLPKRSQDQGWDSYVMELRNSIFIPAIGGEGMDGMSSDDIASATSSQHVNIENTAKKAEHIDGLSGIYGTQKQTIVLVDHHGKATFIERTLYDENGHSTVDSSERDRRFEFDIRGWKKP